MTETDEAARYERIMRLWNASTKGLIAEMNLKVDDASRAGVTIRMPFNPDFCIDEDATLLHGGVLTALLDSAFGLANYMTIDDVQTMATLDLRVEYLRPARSRACTMRARARSAPMRGNSLAISGPSNSPVSAARNGMKRFLPERPVDCLRTLLTPLKSMAY